MPGSWHLARRLGPDGQAASKPTAASVVHPSPSYRQGSTDRGITKEARTVWMAILAAELSAWLTEQSYVRRQRELALDESFRDCSQPDWDGYGAAPANALSMEWARKVLTAFPSDLGVPEIAFEGTSRWRQ